VERSDPPWRVLEAPSPQQTDGQARTGGDPPGTARIGIQPLTLGALAAALLIGAVAVAIALGGTGGAEVAGPIVSGGAAGSERPVGGAGELVVDVAGAVVTPGVYKLAAGARVGDAIDSAGGFSPRVDADRVAQALNLAAALTDGQQIRVPSRDDDPAPIGGAGAGASGGSNGLIDLNAASQDELESLPGIGPVTAGKIIAARAESPFRTVDELRERGLVGQKTFDSIRSLITVG
jgi:competence protein ComEA